MKKIISAFTLYLEKNTIFNYMVYGNKLVIICVFFTFTTILDVALSWIEHGVVSSPYLLLIDRLILCTMTIVPLNLFKYFEKLSVWAIFPLHFVFCCSLSLLYTYISGFFTELYPAAYYEMFRSVVTAYLFFILGALVIDLTRTFKANYDLRKIQEAIIRKKDNQNEAEHGK